MEECRKLLGVFPRSDVLPRPKTRTEEGDFLYEPDAWAEALRLSLPQNAEGTDASAEGIDLARGSAAATSAGAEGIDLARGSAAAKSAGVAATWRADLPLQNPLALKAGTRRADLPLQNPLAMKAATSRADLPLQNPQALQASSSRTLARNAVRISKCLAIQISWRSWI